MPFEEKETHPSYGMIEIGRFSGGHGTFFGSSIKHNGGISLSIKRGSIERSLNRDWFYGNEELIKIQMTYTQFAEMITTGMNASGTPCTITRHDGKPIERPPFVDKRQTFQNEFAKDMEKQAKLLDDLKAQVEALSEKKGTISKKEINQVKAKVTSAHQALKSNMPYVAKSWNEQLEKTMTEAKGAIEGFVESKVRQVGIDAMKEMANISLLESSEEIEVNQIEE